MLVIFKADCPRCGGKKKIRTRVDLSAMTYSRAKCYKCGLVMPGGLLRSPGVRETFTPK